MNCIDFGNKEVLNVTFYDGKISVCLECFFRDIPDAPSVSSADFIKLKANRDKLIQDKVEKMIREYKAGVGE